MSARQPTASSSPAVWESPTGMSIAVSGDVPPEYRCKHSKTRISIPPFTTQGNAIGTGEFNIGVAGDFTLINAGHLVGPPEAFSFSENLDNANLAFYTSPDPIFDYGFLANIDLYSRPLNGTWGSSGQWSDNSLFFGNIEVTYTYTPVPEPATLAIFAASVCLFPLARKRARS